MSELAEACAPVTRCDHICLLDDGHVERGEVHQYGYEHPSPRRGIVPVADVTPPYTDRERLLAGLISTVQPLDQMHPVMALPLARFLFNDAEVADQLDERLAWALRTRPNA